MNGNRQNEAQSGSKSGDQELPGASYNPQPTTKAALTDPRSAKILPLTPPGLSVRFDQRFLRGEWTESHWAGAKLMLWVFPAIVSGYVTYSEFPKWWPGVFH
jgi:hypothetical protein